MAGLLGCLLVGYQQAAGNVAEGLPEEAAAGSTDTLCPVKDDVKICVSMHSCSVGGQSLAVTLNGV